MESGEEKPSRRFTLIIREKRGKKLPAETGSSPRKDLGAKLPKKPGRRKEPTSMCDHLTFHWFHENIPCSGIPASRFFPPEEPGPRRGFFLFKGSFCCCCFSLGAKQAQSGHFFIHRRPFDPYLGLQNLQNHNQGPGSILSSRVWPEPFLQFVLFQYFELHVHLHPHEARPSE